MKSKIVALICAASLVNGGAAFAESHDTTAEGFWAPALREIKGSLADIEKLVRSNSKHIEDIRDEVIYVPERLESDVVVLFTSADDGFTLKVEGIEIGRDRGTASNFNPAKRYRVFDIARTKYVEARQTENSDAMKDWGPVVLKIVTGQPILLELDCWNSGGPSQITYQVRAGAINPVGRRLEGSSVSGKSCGDVIEICYDALLRDDFASNPHRSCSKTANSFNALRPRK